RSSFDRFSSSSGCSSPNGRTGRFRALRGDGETADSPRAARDSRRPEGDGREGILRAEETRHAETGLMAQRDPAPSPPTAGAPEVSLTIPVAPEMEIVATAQADALGEYIDMARDKIDEVKLALVEACINAFEHAQTEDNQVHITFRVGGARQPGEWLEIEVLDRGRGFDTAG